jgi:hypothetical protein
MAFWIFVGVVVDVFAVALILTARLHRRAHDVDNELHRVDPARVDPSDPSAAADDAADGRARPGVDARNAALVTVWQSPALWG